MILALSARLKKCGARQGQKARNLRFITRSGHTGWIHPSFVPMGRRLTASVAAGRRQRERETELVPLAEGREEAEESNVAGRGEAQQKREKKGKTTSTGFKFSSPMHDASH